MIRTFFSRRQFRPTLWPTLALAALVALTVSLGNWQRQRAAEKEALRAQFEQASRAPATGLDERASVADLRFRSVRIEGVFDAAQQVLIDNKIRGGRAGYDVVAPLRLPSGRYVLVDRGWIAATSRHADLPAVPPPVGDVVLTGRINTPPARYLELAAESASRPLRQNLDIARLAQSTGLPLLPYIIEQTGGSDTGDGLLREWPAPDFGSEQHRSYMLQWYSMAALGCVLWLALNWRERP